MDVSLPSGCNLFSDSNKFVNYNNGLATDYFLYDGQVIKGNSSPSDVNYYEGFRTDTNILTAYTFDNSSLWNIPSWSASFAENIWRPVNNQATDKYISTSTNSKAVEGHKIFIGFDIYPTQTTDGPRMFEVYSSAFNGRPRLFTQSLSLDTWTFFNGIVTLKEAPVNKTVYFGVVGSGSSYDLLSDGTAFELRNLKVFDLTEIYGAGNEPTSTQRVIDDYNFSIGSCFNGTLTYKPETQVYFQALAFCLCGLAFFLLFKIFLGRFLK